MAGLRPKMPRKSSKNDREILRIVREFFEICSRRFRKFSKVFGRAWMRSDAFGYLAANNLKKNEKKILETILILNLNSR